jgi:hypothetical protein
MKNFERTALLVAGDFDVLQCSSRANVWKGIQPPSLAACGSGLGCIPTTAMITPQFIPAEQDEMEELLPLAWVN